MRRKTAATFFFESCRLISGAGPARSSSQKVVAEHESALKIATHEEATAEAKIVGTKACDSLLRSSNPASISSEMTYRDPRKFSPGAPVLLELDSVGTVRTEFEKIEA